MLLARRVLLPSHDLIQCRMLVLPSFSEEYSVFVTSDGSRNVVETRKAAEQLWALYPVPREQKPDAGRVNLATVSRTPPDVDTCPIAENTVKALGKAWDAMLASTHGRKGYGGADGTSYHFANRTHAGYAWSPKKGTVARALVKLGESMRELATRGTSMRKQREAVLLEEARALVARLDKLPAHHP